MEKPVSLSIVHQLQGMWLFLTTPHFKPGGKAPGLFLF